MLPLLAVVALTLNVRAGDTLEDFTKLENQMAEALVHGDGPAFQKFLGDDWKIVLSDSAVLTAGQVVEALAKGSLKFTKCTVSELEVRVYGDTAIVRGIDETVGKLDGEDFSGKDRFTDVFIRKDGAWLCIATHDSPME
jgi:hypothetical protein